jgi:hypothetical protein
MDRRPDRLAVPVFVQSSWRTASTWMWAKLRRAPTATAYCEIFHERLNACTIPNLKEDHFAKWNSKHPEAAPYFLEFAPLVDASGAVRGFDPSMAIERFIPAGGIDGALSVAERSYIGGLIQNAYAHRKIPVLTDTRTLGRFSAIADAFPGRHVLLYRNIFHQWASYAEQAADGNSYFIDMHLRTLESSRHDSFVRLLTDWFGGEGVSPNSAAAFQLFLLFHLYLYARAYDAADCVIDVNKLATNLDYRRSTEIVLGEYLLHPIDLSDARTSFGLSLFTVDSKVAFIDAIDQFVKMIDRSVSERASEFVAKAKDEALEEWEKFEFYNRAYRSYSAARLMQSALPSDRPAAMSTPSNANRLRLQHTSTEEPSYERGGIPSGRSNGGFNRSAIPIRTAVKTLDGEAEIEWSVQPQREAADFKGAAPLIATRSRVSFSAADQ